MIDPQISYQGPRWFVGVTEVGRQSRVRLDLSMDGYRVFYPEERRWVSRGRGRKEVGYRPLFAQYVFVEVEYPRQPFPRRDHRSGFLGMLNNGGIPVPVPRRRLSGDGPYTTFVDDLIMRQTLGEFDAIRFDPLPIGARVAIVEGEFRDMLATIVSKRHGIVTVKPEGTNIHARASFGNLRPAEPMAVAL